MFQRVYYVTKKLQMKVCGFFVYTLRRYKTIVRTPIVRDISIGVATYICIVFVAMMLHINSRLQYVDTHVAYVSRGQTLSDVLHTVSHMSRADSLALFLATKITPVVPKVGEYEMGRSYTVWQVLHNMHTHTIYHRKVTVPNGFWYADVQTIINAIPYVTGNAHINPRKVIWADTYFFERDNASRRAIVNRMYTLHMDTAQNMWRKRDKSLPLSSLYDAFVLASIVERETHIAEEKPRIAGVFINRLRKNMKLQSDPTVIYAITGGQGNLNRSLRQVDIGFRSPYNTYTTKGLPPTPIATISLASLQAVLFPEKHDYYYFVVAPQGGHAMAKTLAKHLENVRIYRKSLKKQSK